jgi:hypothetical protein
MPEAFVSSVIKDGVFTENEREREIEITLKFIGMHQIMLK